MKAHLGYLKYVLRHKWFVLLACLEYGLIWRGIKHDWTKFLPSEWFPYVAYFYGKKEVVPNKFTFGFDRIEKPVMKVPDKVQQEFDIAWLHHQKRNSHHWQYWLLSPDQPRPQFNEQSMDGGMTHSWIADQKGKVAAVVYEYDSDIYKLLHPDFDALKRLLADLRNTPIPQKMPMADAKEMIADWRGAGKALGKPNTWEWYEANKQNIFLHPETRDWVEGELTKLKTRHDMVKTSEKDQLRDRKA